MELSGKPSKILATATATQIVISILFNSPLETNFIVRHAFESLIPSLERIPPSKMLDLEIPSSC